METRSFILKGLQLVTCLCVSINLYSQNFTEVKDVFPYVKYAHVQFQDFDCDDDLDIYIWGQYEAPDVNRQLVVYKNKEENQFDSLLVDPFIRFGSNRSCVRSSDINSDNVPEFAAVRGDNYDLQFTQFTNNEFSTVSGPQLRFDGGTSYYGFDIADYDKDGSDEVLSCMMIYDSNKQKFPVPLFENIQYEWSKWIDVNNDGRADILRVHFQQYADEAVSHIYINKGNGEFEKRDFNYKETVRSIEIGDYNNDGYEDIMIIGNPTGISYSVDLYKNDQNGNFSHVRKFDTTFGSKFADIDNDGDLDILLVGHYEIYGTFYVQFIINKGNDEFDMQNDTGVLCSESGEIELADYDKDGDLDLLLTSLTSWNNTYPKLFQNRLVEEHPEKANSQPSEPSELKSTVNFNQVRFDWDQSTDKETPQASLTYNVYIQKEDGTFITSPIANMENGFRRILKKGNAGYKNYYEIDCLGDGTYYWSVQSIDNSNLGSSFATKGRFVISGTVPKAPTDLVARTISDTQVELQWQDNSDIESGFSVEMYYEGIPGQTESKFFECEQVEANRTSCIIENLSPETEYSFRLKSFNCSEVSPITDAITISTYPIPFTKEILVDEKYGREAEWGDFDNDGDLDILIFYTDEDAYGEQSVVIMENKSGNFELLSVDFPKIESFGGSSDGALNWVDFNSDGLLDVCLIKGELSSAEMSLYLNNGDKSFTEVDTDLLPITPGSCGPSFADYDNDGDMDMLFMGRNNDTSTYSITIFDNEGTEWFVKSNIEIDDAYIKSRAPWCDFNGDGYLDFLAFEKLDNGNYIVVIFKNNGDKSFSKIRYEHLQGLNRDISNQAGDARWGDYNSDGYPDILISGQHTGYTGSGVTRIYRNNGDESFSDTGIDDIYGLNGDVSIEWGDINNDGLLDVLQTGDNGINGVGDKTRIFYNKIDHFEKEMSESFLEVHQQGMSSVADYDNDGDLDILNLGEINYTHDQIALFHNFQPIPNTRPEVPSNLHFTQTGDEIILEWDKAEDNETPSEGLSYNVYLKNEDGYVIAPHSISTGKRTLVAIGNAQQNNFMKIKGLKNGQYTWSVQSIDHCFEGSAFADEMKFAYVVTGIEDEIKPESNYEIYPNPCSSYINISGHGQNTDLCSIVICGINGVLLMQKDDIQLPHSIDISSFKSGTYLITIKQSNASFVKKMIKY